MTDHAATLMATLRPWRDRAARLVERRLDDARMHAAAGREATAKARLVELYGSLVRHVSDARGHFYRESFNQHQRAGLDPDIHELSVGPTHDGELAARNTPILGRPYDRDLLDLVEDADRALTSATLAGGGEFLTNWSTTHRDRLVGRANRELSDAQMAIFEAVGEVLVKPELR
jgi:hypothetical protein